ncbi:hypothetical protein Scep_022082 [Stephania cephalantha]|uniref:DWD hypersensitive to UV-B 1 N-terminal domain-containing protein n=1 Tax=Stephania cephalantha TaxID=152367 RepID=A0AAP0HXE5_9MAGN
MGVSVLCCLCKDNYHDLEMEYEASKAASFMIPPPAKLQKSCFERSILQVLLDLLMDVDVPPLIETFSLMRSYEIDAIDIINESPCVLKRENVMSLMRAANQKLRVIFGPSDVVDFVQQHLKLGVRGKSKVELLEYLVA